MAREHFNCIYKCPCGANDKGGSNYPEGICSRAADMEKLEDALKSIIAISSDMFRGTQETIWQTVNEIAKGVMEYENSKD